MHSSARSQGTGLSIQAVSPEELYQVIVDASSQDVSRIKASSERLEAMLGMFGSYDALQEIASRAAYPLPIRQQAMIQFKNAVLGYWRSRKYLSDEHRTRIRERSLIFVDEVDETIASCNEVVVAKIARIDYPDEWPNLIDRVLKFIDTGLQNRYVAMSEDPKETLRLRRTLSLLNEILKEFSSVKLLIGVKVMSHIVEQLHAALSNYYSKMSATFSESNMKADSIASQSVCENILLSHLVYKCLVKMAVWFWGRIPRLTTDGFKPNQVWVEEFFRNSAIQLSNVAILRKKFVLSMLQNDFLRNDQTLRTVVTLTRHLRVFGKFFRRLQNHSIERFMTLPTSEDLILFYWSEIIDCSNHPPEMLSDSDEILFPLRFIVQGMAIFKESLSQWTPRKKSGIANKRSFSQEFVENSVRVLVTRFLPLNASDLENWMSDPEEWVSTEEKENARWEFETRACAEHVIVQLTNCFPDFVVPLLATTFERSAPQPCADLDAVLQKEALYCAVGRCAFRLRDSIQFDFWVDATLAPEAQATDRNYPIIKRRIAWLLGKLVSEQCSAPNNPKVWETLVHLLRDRGSGSDAVVRLTAATALRECVNGKDFVAETFAPFLSTTIPELIRLMAEADGLESKRKVDESLNKVIERSGTFIIPFIPVITEPIPQLWLAAGADYEFKVSLLRTMTRLAESVKDNARVLGLLVVPLVRESFASKSSLMLDYDAVEMWYCTLINTDTIFGPNGVPSLRELYPLLFHLMSTHGDIIGLTLRIVDSSLLLDAPHILQTYANELCRGFLDAFQIKAGDVHQFQVLQGLGLMTQLCPSSMWGEAMHTSGLFPRLLQAFITDEVHNELMAEHIYLFSRLLLADSRLFLQLMAAAAPVLNKPETQLYELLLDRWWGKFDLISQPRYRKLIAMGIAALVGTGRIEVLQRIPEQIIELWADVFADRTDAPPTIALEQTDPDDEPEFVSGWDLSRPPKSYFRESEGTAEYARREALYSRDPICTARVVGYVREKLKEAEANCGAATLQHYFNNTDPETLGQFQELFLEG